MANKMPTELQKHILVLHSKALENNEQVLHIKKGLEEHGHKVHTILDHVKLPFRLNDPNNKYAVLLKTFLLLCSALWFSWFNHTDIIITECHYALIPLLRMFTRAKVVQLCYSMLKTQKKCFTRKLPAKFDVQCLAWAHDLIVPNRMAASLLKENYQLPKLPHVIYPCEDIPISPLPITNPKLLNAFSKDTVTYLCVTDLAPSSKVISLVQALYSIHDRFKIAFDTMPKLLIIGQQYDSASQAVKKHLERVNMFISCFNLTNHIVIHFDDDDMLIYSLIRRCDYFVNITPNQLYNAYMMTAMKFGKAIVSLRSGFAKEIIKNGFNGFLVENDPKSFATALSCLTVVPTVYNYTKLIQLYEFRCSYENRKFAVKYNEFVVGITNGVKVVILDDVLKRVHWRSVMHVVRYGLAYFYVTGYGNLSNVYQYYGPNYIYYAVYYNLTGGSCSVLKQISDIIDSVKHIDLQTMYIQLEWNGKTVVEMGDMTADYNTEEDAIEEHLTKVAAIMRRTDYICEEDFGALVDVKDCIGQCALKMN